MNERFRIGVILKPHGVKGEMKVFPTTDDPKRFKRLKKVIVRTGEREETIPVSSVRFFKDRVILGLEGIDTMDKAERFHKAELFVDRTEAIPLGENEYYAADLIGLSVCSEDGDRLGTLTDVLTTGANDVYVVTGEDGKELLLPAIRECILSVEIEERKMKVHLLKGLAD